MALRRTVHDEFVAARKRSGEAALALCTVACDACSRCAADAAPGLIRMQDNLPVVDYAGGGPARAEATYRCPTGAIQWLEGPQFAEGAPPLRRVQDYHA